MFIFSNGLLKSASTLLSWYQKEIIMHYLDDRPQHILESYISVGQIAGIGHFVDITADKTVDRLIDLSLSNGVFVVKSHAPLTKKIAEEIKSGNILATYIHRDPRDVILSAIDHGKRLLNVAKEQNPFEKYTNVIETAQLIKPLCQSAVKWSNSELATVFTYTQLVKNPLQQLQRFCNMLHIESEESFLKQLIYTYTSAPIKGRFQYNTGKISRHKDEMSIDEIKFCQEILLEELIALGYNIKS